MLKINFGCGLSCPSDWINYDASPTLRAQRLPIFGKILKEKIPPLFPDTVLYGDVTKGLPHGDATVQRVYCSHVLEHLSLTDFRKSLSEVYRILRQDGVFRGVLPDLESEVNKYLLDKEPNACSLFMERTYLGLNNRPKTFSQYARDLFGNSKHLWMWDYKGLKLELENAGFKSVRRAYFNDSEFEEYLTIEEKDRWENCLGFECLK